jgi:hypothetical protein
MQCLAGSNVSGVLASIWVVTGRGVGFVLKNDAVRGGGEGSGRRSGKVWALVRWSWDVKELARLGRGGARAGCRFDWLRAGARAPSIYTGGGARAGSSLRNGWRFRGRQCGIIYDF